MKKIAKGAARILGITVLVLMVSLATFVLHLRSTVPDYTNDHKSGAVAAPISVVRDRHNVPHIKAQNEIDAYYALGRAHALDRGWQMEISRHTVSGRMAELMGPPVADIDVMFRTLGLYRTAEHAASTLSPETLQILEVYCAGVNEVFREKGRGLSPEFLILHHEPEPWTPVDAIAIIKLMSLGLSGNVFNELQRVLLLTELTPGQVSELSPPYPGTERPAIPSLEDLFPEVDFERAVTTAELPDASRREASNNWVVSSAHTATEHPLLANDPHLGLSAPSVWYLAHLSFQDSTLVGATLPGFPALVLGHNGHIAWGFTNTGPDTQDLYLERLNEEDQTLYQTPQGWEPLEVREETIEVRFAANRTLSVRESRHGPLLPRDFMWFKDFPPEGYAFALSWTVTQTDEAGIDPFLALPHLRNWQDFSNALQSFVAPMQNIVYADKHGEIGFFAPGHIPVRKPDHQTQGLMPSAGWLAQNDWQGLLAHQDLPQIHNPATGMIATANQKTTPEGYAHHITYDWSPSYRADRIAKQLKLQAKHDVGSFTGIQLDNISLFAKEILPLLLSAEIDDEGHANLRDMLRTWDGHMRSDRPEPLLFAAWVENLGRLIKQDELGSLADQFKRTHPHFLLNVLRDVEGQSRWCDEVNTEGTEFCEEMIGRALALAISELEEAHGANPDHWRWGKAHAAYHTHTPLGRIPGLAAIFNIYTETGGGRYTPNQGNYSGSGKRPYQNVHGAGYRAVYDFADLNNSVYIQTTGQSGNVASRYYDNFAPLWANGEFISMSIDEEHIRKGAISMTTIEPLSN